MSAGKHSLPLPTYTYRAALCPGCFQHVEANLQQLNLQKAHDVRRKPSSVRTGDTALGLTLLKKDLDLHFFLTSHHGILTSVCWHLFLVKAEIILLGFFSFLFLSGRFLLIFPLRRRKEKGKKIHSGLESSHKVQTNTPQLDRFWLKTQKITPSNTQRRNPSTADRDFILTDEQLKMTIYLLLLG